MTTPQPIGVPSWDLSDRLRKALRHGRVAVQAMADELDMSRKSVGDYINGRATPKRPVLIAWAMRCGVPFEWLAYGVTDAPNTPGGQVIDASGWFSQSPSRTSVLAAVA